MLVLDYLSGGKRTIPHEEKVTYDVMVDVFY